MINSFLAIDLETTGLHPQTDEIIEIGAVRVVNKQIIDCFTELIRPKGVLHSKIIQLTGIDDEMLSDARNIEEVLKDFYYYAGEDVLLGHNVLFDYSFLKTNLLKYQLSFLRKGIDTLFLSRNFHKNLESRKLENMCKFYGIHHKNAHRALGDASAAMDLFFRLQENYGNQNKEIFSPKELLYQVKKEDIITMKQKNYLLDLIKYHKIETSTFLEGGRDTLDKLTKSEASKKIDGIILKYGRIGM